MNPYVYWLIVIFGVILSFFVVWAYEDFRKERRYLSSFQMMAAAMQKNVIRKRFDDQNKKRVRNTARAAR